MKTIQISTCFRHEAHVDPIEFIEKLIEDTVGHRRYLKHEDDGKYYLMEQGSGHFRDEKLREVSEEEYNYAVHLREALLYLKKIK